MLPLFIFLSLAATVFTSCPAAPRGNPCRDCPDAPILSDNLCVSSCPFGHVVARNKGYLECKKCDLTKSLLPNAEQTECVCAIQHFITPLNGECAPCHYSCLTCSGPNENNCLTCRSDELQTFRELTRRRTCVCVSGYTEDGENLGLKCVGCHPDCETCSGPGDNECLTCGGRKTLDDLNFCVCNDNFISNENGTCECPSSLFSVRNARCVERNSNCGPNQVQVTQKKNDKSNNNKEKENNNNRNTNQRQIQIQVLETPQCACRAGFNRIKGRCAPCGPNQQYNPKSRKCQCVKGANKFRNRCIVCPEGQRFKKRTGRCECRKNEQKTEEGECIRCNKREVYRNGQCECVPNYYRFRNGKCRKCNSRRDNQACREVSLASDRPVRLERIESA